jgi:hypothetical protein
VPDALPEVLRQRLEDPEMWMTARLILLSIALTDDPQVGEIMRGWFGRVRAPLTAALRDPQPEVLQHGPSPARDVEAVHHHRVHRPASVVSVH